MGFSSARALLSVIPHLRNGDGVGALRLADERWDPIQERAWPGDLLLAELVKVVVLLNALVFGQADCMRVDLPHRFLGRAASLNRLLVELEDIECFPAATGRGRSGRHVKQDEEVLHPFRQAEHDVLRLWLQVDDDR